MAAFVSFAYISPPPAPWKSLWLLLDWEPWILTGGDVASGEKIAALVAYTGSEFYTAKLLKDHVTPEVLESAPLRATLYAVLTESSDAAIQAAVKGLTASATVSTRVTKSGGPLTRVAQQPWQSLFQSSRPTLDSLARAAPQTASLLTTRQKVGSQLQHALSSTATGNLLLTTDTDQTLKLSVHQNDETPEVLLADVPLESLNFSQGLAKCLTYALKCFKLSQKSFMEGTQLLQAANAAIDKCSAELEAVITKKTASEEATFAAFAEILNAKKRKLCDLEAENARLRHELRLLGHPVPKDAVEHTEVMSEEEIGDEKRHS